MLADVYWFYNFEERTWESCDLLNFSSLVVSLVSLVCALEKSGFSLWREFHEDEIATQSRISS